MRNPFIKTERSYFLAIFGLPFFLVGLGMFIFSILPTLYDGWRMQGWTSTAAHLLGADMDVNYSDDSTTYRAMARYRYIVNGKQYTNDRVSISNSPDNVGDFQQRLGSWLKSAQRAGSTIPVWFDPRNPADSIIKREMRWGLLSVKMVFVLVFGVIGFVLIFLGLRGKKVNTAPETVEKPWLRNPDWQGGLVRSGAKAGVYGTWGIALFWNLISTPLLFQLRDIWDQKGGMIVLIALIFPAVGIGLVAWAIRASISWRKFGRTPLQMDPFPGAIGGDVGGEIKLAGHYDPGLVYEVTLSCLYSYISGSGKNRSRREDVIWQDSGYARAAADMGGVKLSFRFNVPQGLKETGEKSGSSYHLWRLNLHANMEGTDLDRDFEIPVYATAEVSRHLQLNSVEEQPPGVRETGIESVLPLVHGPLGMELYYPVFRRPLFSLMIIAFGIVFSAVGVFLWSEAQKEGGMLYAMAGVFTLAGGVIVLSGVYSAGNSLRVIFDGVRVTSIRKLFGMPVSTRSAHYDQILAVESKKTGSIQQGSRHIIDYGIYATHSGGKITLAEQLKSHSKVEQAIDYFKQLLMN